MAGFTCLEALDRQMTGWVVGYGLSRLPILRCLGLTCPNLACRLPGGNLHAIQWVADGESCVDPRSDDRPCSLLHHVRQFVRQQVIPFVGTWRVLPSIEDDVAAYRVCLRIHYLRRLHRLFVCMHSHLAEIVSEA